MSRFLKIGLVCLSMIAIPVQGFAASTMFFCGLAHQHTKTVREAGPHSAHTGAGSLTAHHQHNTSSSLDSSAPAFHGEDFSFTGDEHAGCFPGAAVPALVTGFQPVEHATEPIVSQQFTKFGFVTDGPKRPPRSPSV